MMSRWCCGRSACVLPCAPCTFCQCDAAQLLALREELAGPAPREALCEAATGEIPGT